jgi:hypothetical protein
MIFAVVIRLHATPALMSCRTIVPDTADLKVCTTFFLCGAPSVKRARNIPGEATNDKYAKSKQLFVIGVGFIWQKWIKSIRLTVSSRSKSIHGDYSIRTELLLE